MYYVITTSPKLFNWLWISISGWAKTQYKALSLSLCLSGADVVWRDGNIQMDQQDLPPQPDGQWEGSSPLPGQRLAGCDPLRGDASTGSYTDWLRGFSLVFNNYIHPPHAYFVFWVQQHLQIISHCTLLCLKTNKTINQIRKNWSLNMSKPGGLQTPINSNTYQLWSWVSKQMLNPPLQACHASQWTSLEMQASFFFYWQPSLF